MDKGEEARGELVKAHGDSAKLLEFEEERFHEMAFLVKTPVDVPRIRDVLRGWDAEISAMIGDELAKFPLAISSVSKDGRTLEVDFGDQFFGGSDVSGIASGQHYRYRVAQSVHGGMNLRASAATTDTNALIDLGFVYANLLVLGGGFYGISGF